MKSYKRDEYLKCPHCNKELTGGVSEDYAVCEGKHKYNIEGHECYECYENFYVQYNKSTDMVDVTI